ncbi:unnamed protein product [Ectocarpus sp. 12 AP-2014]
MKTNGGIPLSKALPEISEINRNQRRHTPSRKHGWRSTGTFCVVQHAESTADGASSVPTNQSLATAQAFIFERLHVCLLPPVDYSYVLTISIYIPLNVPTQPPSFPWYGHAFNQEYTAQEKTRATFRHPVNNPCPPYRAKMVRSQATKQERSKQRDSETERQ